MGRHTGVDGVVKISDTQLLSVRSWTLDTTADTVEQSVIGVHWRQHKESLKSGSGTFELYFDDEDATVAVPLLGTTVEVELYPVSDADGANYFSFVAIVTSLPTNGGFDSMVEQSIGYTVNGAITEGVVTPPGVKKAKKAA